MTRNKEVDMDLSSKIDNNIIDCPLSRSGQKRRRLSKHGRKILKKGKKKNIHDDDGTNKTIKCSNEEQQSTIRSRNDQHIVQQENNDDIIEEKNFKNDLDKNDEDEITKEEDHLWKESLKTYSPLEIPTIPSNDVMISKNNKHNETQSGNTIEMIKEEGNCRSLGKWFPNALIIKSKINYTNTGKLIVTISKNQTDVTSIQDKDILRVDNPKSSLVLFYQYTTLTNSIKAKEWTHEQLQILMTYISTIAKQRHIGGRIRIAPEGVNATISAVDTEQSPAQHTIRHFAYDLKKFDPQVFQNTDFKFFDNLSPDRHFKELKILPVKELVFYDIHDTEAPLVVVDDNNIAVHCQTIPDNDTKKNVRNDIANGVKGGGIHLDATEYHKMLQKDNTVVIDVRNHYETILGRFDGQQQLVNKTSKKNGKDTNFNDENNSTVCDGSGGAEYIDPKMRKSTDFKTWLANPETKQKLQNKTVLMYCTGGIRCERASSYLKNQMGDDVNGVYQLQGGIERYLKTFKDGGFWRGKNFVFDKREAVSIENPDGDGGVIRKHNKKKQKQQPSTKDHGAKCCVCGDPWDRYVGKKKCLTCGVPVLMCDKCMSLKPDKTPGMELKVRCPLCVEENVTVLAKEVEYTANGIKNKVVSNLKVNHEQLKIEKKYPDTIDNTALEVKAKAAESVLKWGGGHANKKKQLKKMKRRLCQFGADCVRLDCFFYHPERDSTTT